jgi:hypothetical protein
MNCQNVSKTFGRKNRKRLAGRLAVVAILAAALSLDTARADEGGVSFWLPGMFGS